jgi:hypothetical protein
MEYFDEQSRCCACFPFKPFLTADEVSTFLAVAIINMAKARNFDSVYLALDPLFAFKE